MSDRPIIFSAPMIRALLDGRKTQMRQALKAARGVRGCDFQEAGPHPSGVGRIWECPRGMLAVPYAAGDRLWVREAWRIDGAGSAVRAEACRGHRAIQYRADGYEPRSWDERSPIHMPRWASRLTLIVSDVRVRRVQAISEEDAMAEGVEPVLGPSGGSNTPHVEGFRNLWNATHGSYAWATNPWVAAISFSVERRNIDAETPDV